jgi:hypothetical protein
LLLFLRRAKVRAEGISAKESNNKFKKKRGVIMIFQPLIKMQGGSKYYW